MRSRSVASSLVLVLLLSIAAPLAAASREREPRWQGPFDGIVRFVKKVLKKASNGDMMSPPTPSRGDAMAPPTPTATGDLMAPPTP